MDSKVELAFTRPADFSLTRWTLKDTFYAWWKNHSTEPAKNLQIKHIILKSQEKTRYQKQFQEAAFQMNISISREKTLINQ